MASLGFFYVLWTFCLPGIVLAKPYHDPHCGGRQVIVHLFEWKWTDIAKECMDYLGPLGFCGVQVSPPNEHVLVTTDAMRPWWERYQPVSYKLTSRSGDENEFEIMVATCKSVGVRIYVDAVINHMAGLGRSGKGSAGSSFNSSAFSFPGVPYTKVNFNDRSKCPSSSGNVDNYGDAKNVRNCFLDGLTDLDGGQSYVRDKVSGYLNHLIDLGVAGFRIDAAKHMWPKDIKAIQTKLKDLPEGGRPFFYLEVKDQNNGAVHASEYYNMGYVTDFPYCKKIKRGANDLLLLHQVFDPSSNKAPSSEALVFVDNQDNQRSRNHEALTFKQPAAYKRAVAFTLAYNYGFPKVMSSYDFSTFEQGPPHNSDYSTKDVITTPSGGCQNGWICEHRWNPIGHMALFRNAVDGEKVDNWSFKDQVISFNRGNKGYFAMSNKDFKTTVSTGLPPGKYCDLISACVKMINVNNRGIAEISPASGSEPFVAIITKAGKPVATFPAERGNPLPNIVPSTTENPVQKTETTGSNIPSVPKTTNAPATSQPTESGYKKTVILIEYHSTYGTDLFIDGGIDINHRPGCTVGVTPSPCSIPIRHIFPGSNSHFDKVKAWSVGDHYLDWNGAEPGQGTYQGNAAVGTPAYWSTTDTSHPGYSKYNRFGPHYWIVEVDMDCSKTMNGYFEFKARMKDGWEYDIAGGVRCSGDSAGTPPYKTKNHFARCGYLNVFHYGSKSCEIDKIP